jgi:hypothetical protein
LQVLRYITTSEKENRNDAASRISEFDLLSLYSSGTGFSVATMTTMGVAGVTTNESHQVVNPQGMPKRSQKKALSALTVPCHVPEMSCA